MIGVQKTAKPFRLLGLTVCKTVAKYTKTKWEKKKVNFSLSDNLVLQYKNNIGNYIAQNIPTLYT